MQLSEWAERADYSLPDTPLPLAFTAAAAGSRQGACTEDARAADQATGVPTWLRTAHNDQTGGMTRVNSTADNFTMNSEQHASQALARVNY